MRAMFCVLLSGDRKWARRFSFFSQEIEVPFIFSYLGCSC